jgi:hypothetical protein
MEKQQQPASDRVFMTFVGISFIYSEAEWEFIRELSLTGKFFYRNIFWYEMLLIVLLWIVYHERRAQ